MQTNNYHACLPSLKVARKRGLPIACFVHGLFGQAWRKMRGPIVGRAFEAFERYLVRRPYDRWIFPSEFALRAGVLAGARPERSVVVSPGVDLARHQPEAAKQDAVLFAGKLDVRKGIFEVLEAARRLPDVQFRIAGWGPLEERVRREKTANVELLGFLDGERMTAEFDRSRIFFFPSHAETFEIGRAHV